MKNLPAILLLLLSVLSASAQRVYLQAEGSNTAETRILDSLSYNKVHENGKSVIDEANALSGTLTRIGYLENNIVDSRKLNDSTFLFLYSVGKRTKSICIYTGLLSAEEKNLLAIDADTLTLPLQEVEGYMNNKAALLERAGYSLSSLRLANHEAIGNNLRADLIVKGDRQRTLDDIVLQGYTKFPEGIRKNILRQYRGKTFNQETLTRVHKDFSDLRFVNQLRYPEILFKKDTTKVYVYLEKARPNTFDGFVGFANDENSDIVFTGYVDVLLNNVLNTGEKFNLYWKSDGNEQTTFNIGLELPYIFQTPIGLKGELRIFKQDSTFQNTMTDINIGYYFSYNSKLYVGRQSTESVDIQNLNSSTLSDYSNAFWTSTYDYTNYSLDDFLFPEKTRLFIKAGFGERDSKFDGSTSQYFGQLQVNHNLYLNKKNIIHLKNHSFYLKSSDYIINELYRFGGINSIRGFNENSLQASLYSALMAEYRYVLSPSIYVHSITDYGYFQDESNDVRENLLGLGFGFGLLTKTGLFNIIYANGSMSDQAIKLSNSIVHISFRTSF
ncbi:hypothetical protein LRS05_05605 [Flavobacterium sp. J372]|uniref:hypothetical protein n=1 Tax=Flavobacterium sp. J372 TaxID=2898436 RepID=UPI002151BFD1|nr:hypothetical protein [Flavobacterium sp. J372]MCR5861642.1 hypothetical protein [Flavobacterium sp. J372]